MVNYREILRLSSDPKNSQRSIELMLHSSHHTIRKVQDAAKAAGISWPLEDDVTNEMLKEALCSRRKEQLLLSTLSLTIPTSTRS